MNAQSQFLAEARVDKACNLLEAGEPLAGLQLACGGEIPGAIAVPALRELVEKALNFQMKLARSIKVNDGNEVITAWVEVDPQTEAGCLIRVSSWQGSNSPELNPQLAQVHEAAIERTLAELTAHLDARQAVLNVESHAEDLADLVRAMREGLGRPWTDFVEIEGNSHNQPMHWRLLDGAQVRIAGSTRPWQASLFPQEAAGAGIVGFELCLSSQEPEATAQAADPEPEILPSNEPGLVGRDIAPVLRQPIARIIANAETIRTRMAGPLAEEYSQYAADIAAAGQHLLALVEDLADLEVVEAEDFNTAPDRIDLADVARRAAGILAVRAQERGIAIAAPGMDEHLPAIAEFRRVLQVLLNLVGNAIRYAPENSTVTIALRDAGSRARLIISDEGPGLRPDQQEKVFEKFERLGRSGEDGGSGLGLYISRRLARAMGGELTVESAPGEGARFTLEVPADLLASAPTTTQNPDKA